MKTAVLVLVLAFVGSYLGNALDDHDTRKSIQLDLNDAINSEAANARFTRAALELCGYGAEYGVNEDGSLFCITNHRQASTLASN